MTSEWEPQSHQLPSLPLHQVLAHDQEEAASRGRHVEVWRCLL
jgi:hypothetical protein